MDYQITQHGLTLEKNFELFPTQFSENVKVEFIRDSKYNGLIMIPFIAYGKDKQHIITPKMLEDDSLLFPKEVFEESGTISLSFSIAQNTEIKNTDAINIRINRSAGKKNVLPANEDTWKMVLSDFLMQELREHINPAIETILTDTKKLQDEANNQQLNALKQQEIVSALIEIEKEYQKEEITRKDAEKIRIEAENLRILNETTRIDAENKREIETSTVIEEAYNATINANNAAETAQNAVQNFSNTKIKFTEAKQLENINDGEQLNILFGKLKKFYTSLIPVGTVLSFSGETPPEGYLLCHGQTLSRNEYADLFNIIGSKYGNGDGNTTFNLPDLRSRIAIGLDNRDTSFNQIGNIGGEKNHAITLKELPAHHHSATTTTDSSGTHMHSASSNSIAGHTHSITGTATSAGGHTHTINNSGTLNIPIYVDNVASGTNKVGFYPKGTGFSNINSIFTWDEGTQNHQVSAIGGVHAHSMNSTGAHTHSISGTAVSNGSHSHSITINNSGAHTHTGNTIISDTGDGSAHNNMQPYIILNYIIKY